MHLASSFKFMCLEGLTFFFSVCIDGKLMSMIVEMCID